MLRRRVDATVAVLGLVSLGPLFFGLLCGIAVDRVQAAHERAAVLEPDKDSLQARNRQLMAIELQTHGRHEAFQREWRQRLDRIGEAVTLGDTRTAMAVWREGYAAAMQRGQWRDLIDIGDAALRIGDIADFAETAPGAARRSYLTALHRAQSQGSVDGILQVAAGFAGLGDTAALQNCVDIARRVADGNPEAQSRVVSFAERFTAATGGR
jgi:hypothetical protein